MEFGDRLRETRKRRGFSQAKLAGLVGITTRSLQYYESGQRRPQSTEVVLSLAQALEVPLSELTGEAPAEVGADGQDGGRTNPQHHQLNSLLAGIAEMMNGGTVSAEDQRAFMCAVNDIYFNAQRRHGAVKEYRIENYLNNG